jgi:hypothetical protein
VFAPGIVVIGRGCRLKPWQRHLSLVVGPGNTRRMTGFPVLAGSSSEIAA